MMQLNLKPDLQARIDRLAGTTGTDPSDVAAQIIERYIDHDEWFRLEVQKGINQANQGELLDHDDVIGGIERLIASKTR